MKRPFNITFVLTYDNGATSKTINICCNLDFWMGALFFDASIGAGDAAYIDTSSYIKVYKDLNRFTNAFTNEAEFKKVHAAAVKNTESFNGVAVLSSVKNLTYQTNYITNDPDNWMGGAPLTSAISSTVQISTSLPSISHTSSYIKKLYFSFNSSDPEENRYFAYIRYLLSLLSEDKFAKLYEQFLKDCKTYITKFQENLYFIAQDTPYKILDSTDYDNYEPSIKELLNSFR